MAIGSNTYNEDKAVDSLILFLMKYLIFWRSTHFKQLNTKSSLCTGRCYYKIDPIENENQLKI